MKLRYAFPSLHQEPLDYVLLLCLIPFTKDIQDKRPPDLHA